MHWTDRWHKLTGKRPRIERKERNLNACATGSIYDSARKLHSQKFKQSARDLRRLSALAWVPITFRVDE